MKIIGISGTFAAGKDTLAQYLVDEHGYQHISTSDLIREEAMKRFGKKDRAILLELANELRGEHGPGVLVQWAIDRATEGTKGLVISGIRSIGEVELLHERDGELYFVDADPKIRYERAYSRKREGEDSLTFEQFMATEKKEFDKPRDNKSEQNIAGVKELADVCLDNGKEEHDLQDAFDAVLRGGTQKGAKTLVIYLSAYGAMGAPFHKTVFFEAYSELIELITARGHRAVIARGSSYQQDGQFSSYFTYNEAEKTYEHVKEPVTADLILNRDSENTIPRIEDCTILNHPDFDEICRDKVKTAEHLEEVSGVTRIVNSYAEAQEAFEAIPSDLIVMKPRFGEQAFGVYILERSKIDESLYEDWSDIIVQEFLDSSQGIPGLVEGVHEINIFAVNGTFAGARMKKPPEGELISSATGAVVGEVWGLHRDQIPDELWQETQKISEQFSEFRPQLFRADFVRNSDGRYKLIEINSRPGLMHQDKEGADFYMDFNGRIVDAVDEFLSSLES